MMNKLIKYFFYLYLTFLLGFITNFINQLSFTDSKLELLEVNVVNYDEENNLLKLNITSNNSGDYICHADSSLNKYNSLSSDNSCYINVKVDDNYIIYLTNSKGKTSETYYLNDLINNLLSFKFTESTIYLTVGEEVEIPYQASYLGADEEKYDFQTPDDDILEINNNLIVGLKAGETTIFTEKSNEKLTVIVSDLITAPYLSETKKEIVPCNVYTEEEADILDNLLSTRINKAGFKTRAGAVAAARFLTLEFKYRIPYFYENGRVHSSGVHFVDGEGRYYKTGLYLSNSKKEDILASWTGPAIWGCPLKNLENRPEYGYIAGQNKPNGLDCSGFVSWVLKNAGFDPGDIGAGESEYPYQMTDLAKFVPLTKDLINSNTIKTGDLINFWGHIAIIIGIDEDNYYIAESLPYLGGVVAKKYPKDKVMNTFTYVVLMDSYYQEDGNYTAYWN
jgi:hypothetical protein